MEQAVNKRWRANVEYEVDLPGEMDEGEASEMLADLVAQAFELIDPQDAHKAMIRVAGIDAAMKT